MIERPSTDSWRLSAACRGMDPELFFPQRGEPVEPALAVCAQCPVVEPCRSYAVVFEGRGVWGGMSERSRIAVRREMGQSRPELREVVAA
ncbi:MAG: WhiB family transcriptional regulator [Acidobacteriota bacterium]